MLEPLTTEQYSFLNEEYGISEEKYHSLSEEEIDELCDNLLSDEAAEIIKSNDDTETEREKMISSILTNICEQYEDDYEEDEDQLA